MAEGMIAAAPGKLDRRRLAILVLKSWRKVAVGICVILRKYSPR